MRWIAIVFVSLLGLIVLAAGTLFAMGFRSTAGRLAATIDIDRSPEQVFPWLEEPDLLTQWVGWLVEVREETPGERGPGARRTWLMDDPNRKQRIDVRGETVAREAGRALVVKSGMEGGFDGEATYRLTDRGDGHTRLSSEGHFKLTHWFARLMEPVVTSQAQKKLTGDLARLKQRVEAAR
jgi:uncharacterized protein YndB with AHSA1/START domain